MLKILHCADLHIDTVFSGLSAKAATESRNRLKSAFSKTVEAARNNGVKLFLIAGDFFDSDTTSYNTLSELAREMASLPECKFVIAPGNHDHYVKGGSYDFAKWPSNVYIFRSEKLEKFSFDDINTDVYGYAFCDKYMKECPLEDYVPDDRSRINIILAHGDTEDVMSNYCPIRKKLLESLDADYIALGHIHKGNTVYGGEKYAYPGCLAPCDFGETGYKGFIMGELSKHKRDMKFRVLSGKRFEIEALDVTELLTKEKISAAIDQICSKYDTETNLRITLTGSLCADVGSITASDRAKHSVEKLEITDNTSTAVGYSELEDDPTLKGVVFRMIKPYLESNDKSEREKGKLALKYVFSALSGQKDFT